MIPAFPKILTLGQRFTENLFSGPVEITEKIDGSQFNFGKLDGHTRMRSKGAEVFFEDNNKMFNKAKEFVRSIEDKLPEGVVFHGEYLQAPRHNTLAYSRVPANNFVLFGVSYGLAPDSLDHRHPSRDPAHDRALWAANFKCDQVPVLFNGLARSDDRREWLMELMGRESYLGGQTAEGIVIKNYNESVMIGGIVVPVLMAKLVGEDFKEKHKVEWKANNPDKLTQLAEAYNAKPRWQKAIQRLAERGELTNSPRDIGPLLKEVNIDIADECQGEIKDLLWNLFRKDILRIATKGLPEWYKQKLAEEIMAS